MEDTITLKTGLVEARLHVDGCYELEIDGQPITDYYCSICAHTMGDRWRTCDGEGDCVHKRLLRTAIKKYEGVPELVVIGNHCLCGKEKHPDAEWCNNCQEELALIDEWSTEPTFHPCMPDEDAYREWRQTLITYRTKEEQ